jgi:myo-inositol-1(or 4)-monophosphatase
LNAPAVAPWTAGCAARRRPAASRRPGGRDLQQGVGVDGQAEVPRVDERLRDELPPGAQGRQRTVDSQQPDDRAVGENRPAGRAAGHQPAAFAAQDPGAPARSGSSLSAVRNLGPTSWQVADVASGRLDGFWEFGEDSASLLAREAGVTVTDASGPPWRAGAGSFAAAPAQPHPELLAALG